MVCAGIRSSRPSLIQVRFPSALVDTVYLSLVRLLLGLPFEPNQSAGMVKIPVVSRAVLSKNPPEAKVVVRICWVMVNLVHKHNCTGQRGPDYAYVYG